MKSSSNSELSMDVPEFRTLGVEPEKEKNKIIYSKYGFTEHIKDAQEVYPDGTTIDVEYYGKKLK